ncbi:MULTISPECIES: hypothetical protein [Actinomadura]|uniref:Uncharacterized protein n=1 Tax=Actinomadura litoris TaxID=2678616 RepID=A0A7K1L5T0_9ACTN|nr:MULTISPECIES: hypothetical protein [Actinomadura]MBT2208519.1 hypothetical protein [Actinomadura sp. NEAU-AAG7]MUN39749.1 hypothetical protein [Actinomadura litoris]
MSQTDDREQPVPDEAPEADTAEQRADLAPGEEEQPREWTAQLPFDADEADAADQRREISLDEDDYR